MLDTPQGAVLIDAGLGPRTTARRLHQAGLTLADLHAVCLTHLDRDHFRPTWLRPLKELGIKVHLHTWHVSELMQLERAEELEAAGMVQPFDDASFEVMPGVVVRTVRLQHDRQGTTGYRFDFGRASVGYATDLGHAPAALIDLFAGVGLLCLEANYDEKMTVNSSRPSFVNRRNMSDSGHLSNEQALDAVQRIAAKGPGMPGRVVLMHRSTQCNHPTKLKRVFERDPRMLKRVTLAEQRKRTRWFSVAERPAVVNAQMGLL